MNRTHLWKLFLIIFVVCWAAFEMTPLSNRDLFQHFQERASGRDATYSNIVTRASELMAADPGRPFRSLMDAAGTNDLSRYFPHLQVQNEKEPNLAVLHRLQREAAGQLKLGLDLQGGTAFIVEMDTASIEEATNGLTKVEAKEKAIENAVEVLRKRVDRLGVSEPIIQPAGENRILIQLPGLTESAVTDARAQIEKAAFLEFRMVHPSNVIYMSQGLVPPGYEVLKMESKQADGRKVLVPYLVKKTAEDGLTGKYLKRAMVTRAELTNEPEINFELNPEGATLFGNITRKYKPEDTPQGRFHHQLAIVLDGELYSAPQINEPIEGGKGQITGQFDLAEALTLANVLENPLEAPVKLINENRVDPSLGKDSIRSGVRATIIGTIAVAAFILGYYLMAGFIANVALVLNLIILMGVLASIDATLTLPGIAGIVLTVGMAVDANVLIYERIREELRAGKSLRGAVSAGYSKAFGTIFDSNLTTLISAVILIYMGTGPVKGFGVTLTIGICVSMFTALVVTRLLFDFTIAKGWLKELKMVSFIGETKINFLRFAKPAFIISWLLIMAGIAYGISRGRDAFGVEFVGGDHVTYAFAKKVSTEDLRKAVEPLGVGDVSIQYQREITTGSETLHIITRSERPAAGTTNAAATVITGNNPALIQAALEKTFPEAGFRRLSLDQVGPSVGAEVMRTAIVAVLLSLFGILLYVSFRYELSFAVAAVVAILHDVLMTMGWFFLSGRELSGPIVAAILTIIGFSINDTIVIFDRIREDLKLGARGSFADVINRALNETLARTIITSGTVLMATLALYLFGGGVINDFAFTFLVGILTGTYSTIFIASALVLWWHKGQRPKSSSQVTMEKSVTAPA